MYGAFTFIEMPEYGAKYSKHKYTVMGVNVDQEIKSAGNSLFNRLGFRDSFLANCEMIFYKYVIIILLLIIMTRIRDFKAINFMN